MVTVQMIEVALVAKSHSSTHTASRSILLSWRRHDNPTRHYCFRQIIIKNRHIWKDLHLENEVLQDQRAYLRKTVQR